MTLKPTTMTIALLTVALAGCLDDGASAGLTAGLDATDFHVPSGFDGTAADITWPDLSNRTLRILDHGAFFACEDAGAIFTELTGAGVECTAADDTGSALHRAVAARGDPEFHILYGIDNILLDKADTAGIFHDYTPELADRVGDEYLFFDRGVWPATPVDHGYIALNIDTRHAGMDGVTITDLDDVLDHAHLFVTEDPRFSTPGLGFMLITIDAYGDDWLGYWNDLFDAGVKVTPDWSTAYEVHFSGGYGIWTEGHIGDRPIVTSYTESPAYEAYYGAENVSAVLLAHDDGPAVFHQIQTMGILRGTDDLALAQAWIEFTLTDDFQAFAASYNAVYPTVTDDDDVDTSVDDVYGDVDPEPGSFEVVEMDHEAIADNLSGWIDDWLRLCKVHDCA